MKEIYIKIIKFLIGSLVAIFILFFLLKSEIFKEIFYKKEIQERVDELKEKLEEIKEIPKQFEPQIGEKVENLPESGLKIKIEIKSKNNPQNFFFIDTIISENDVFWKITPRKYSQTLKLFGFFFEWRKNQIKEKEVQDLLKLKEILEKRTIFKKFEKINEEYEIEINKEELKNGILEWKKEINQKDLENFFENLSEISGKILVDENNFIRNLEIEEKDTKIILKIENLNEDILKEEKVKLENFLISILKIPENLI